jgi:hypothetical protein
MGHALAHFSALAGLNHRKLSRPAERGRTAEAVRMNISRFTPRSGELQAHSVVNDLIASDWAATAQMFPYMWVPLGSHGRSSKCQRDRMKLVAEGAMGHAGTSSSGVDVRPFGKPELFPPKCEASPPPRPLLDRERGKSPQAALLSLADRGIYDLP